MEYQNQEYRKVVTLILQEQRFKVDKQKLIEKSHYFAALLSANFIEFNRTEHIINYEIPLISFKDFIDWLDSDKLGVFISIYNEDQLERLMLLLELGVLFAVDKLIEDVSYTIERYYLLPNHVIDIWLLAQELNLKILQDLCLATCLDRFTELPHDSISYLSKQNFVELVGNINVRSSESYLREVVHTWTRCHKDDIPLNILNNKQPKILHGIISSENLNDINTKFYIHCWDNGNNFFELATFKYPTDIINNGTGRSTITGMQITARGYNLYLCGGEFGIGTKKFNTKVWRYSLISKKWFLQTIMPNPRRHMIATFLDTELLLIGGEIGKGEKKKKLNTVDIYDVHKDQWFQGAKMPLVSKKEVPKHIVLNGRIFIYSSVSRICVYYENKWDIIKPRIVLGFVPDITGEKFPKMLLKTGSCYIDTVNPDDMILKIVTKTCDIECCNHKAPIGTCMKIYLNYIPFITTHYQDEKKCTPYIKLYYETLDITNIKSATDILMGMELGDNPRKFYIRSIPIQYPEKFRFLLSSSSTISLSNPVDLHIQST